MSIGDVTTRMRGFSTRLANKMQRPKRTLSPSARPVTSRRIKRNGTLFHAKMALGHKNARRCPANTVRMPQWNGTEPQNSVRPSRNCEEIYENVKGRARSR